MKKAAFVALPLCLAFLPLPAAAAETAQHLFFPSLINTVTGVPISGDEFSAAVPPVADMATAADSLAVK